MQKVMFNSHVHYIIIYCICKVQYMLVDLKKYFIAAKSKFEISNSKLVLADGCEIEDDDAFDSIPSNTEIFILKNEESLPGSSSSRASSSNGIYDIKYDSFIVILFYVRVLYILLILFYCKWKCDINFNLMTESWDYAIAQTLKQQCFALEYQKIL